MSDNSRFLDIVGKCTIIQGTSKDEQLARNLNNDEYYRFVNDISTFKGFFFNLHHLNTDKILKETEFIVGIYGDVEVIKINTVWNCIPENLFVITNRFNLFSCKIKLGQPRYADFNDAYELRLHQTNNFTLNPQQIQLINTTFHSVKLNFKNHDKYTKYTFMDSLMYEAYCHKYKYMELCNKYNYNYIFPPKCGVKMASNENCCQNCFENRKKQLKIYSVKSIKKYSAILPTNQFISECSQLYDQMKNYMMGAPIIKEIESQLQYYKLNNTILKHNEEELDDEICSLIRELEAKNTTIEKFIHDEKMNSDFDELYNAVDAAADAAAADSDAVDADAAAADADADNMEVISETEIIDEPKVVTSQSNFIYRLFGY